MFDFYSFLCYTWYRKKGSEVQTMPKFLVTVDYVEIWKMLVEAESKEEAEDIAAADIFDNGFEVDGYMDDMKIQEVSDNFALFGDSETDE